MMSETDKKWLGRFKRWAVLFGIPLVLLLVGMWQWSRVDNGASVQALIVQYQQVIEELDAIQAQDKPTMGFVKDSKGPSVLVSLLKDRYQTAIRELQAGGLYATTRGLQPTLALCTMVFSVVALLWSAIGVGYQRSMGKKAMESRVQLLVTFEKGRKLLPTYMVVMVLLLFAAAIPMQVYEIMSILRHRNYSKGDMKFMLFLGGMVIFLLYSGGKVLWDVWKASRKPMKNEPIDVMGQSLSRQQAPELWAFVDRVASKTGAGMPDSIVVGLNEGFFVTEHPVKLASGSMVPQGRVLYLPLPYMAFLNAGEVAAVIGHELGHFIGEDTLYSQRFSPIYSATINHLVAISGGEDYEESWMDILRKPATLFGEMFLDSFHEAVRYWSRMRELAADAVGASVASPQAIASSLLRITALAPHVDEALEMNWEQGQSAEGGIVGHVRQLVATKGMVDPSVHLHNRQSHPTDTHPELAARLEALGVPLTAELLNRAMDPQASHLLQELGLEQGAGTATANAAQAGAIADGPVSDVSSSLQQELTGVAAANRANKREALKEIAAQGSNRQVIYERSIVMVVLFGFLMGVMAVLGVTMMLMNNPQIGGGLGLLVAAAAFAFGAHMYWRDSKEPALVLLPEGVVLFNAQEPLPWSAVEDMSFSENDQLLTVSMPLEAGVVPPAMGVRSRRGQFVKKKQCLVIMLKGVKTMKNEAFAELMLNYWYAYRARQELARMGAQA